MVARYVCVEFLPDALDAIRVGTVRRQEVEHDAVAQLDERLLGELGVVDAVAV